MTPPEPAAPALARRAKKFIKSAVTVHDRTQIETVFDYYLYRGRTPGPERGWFGRRWLKRWKPTLRYRVDAFLFYPRQFGLDANTYPKERFFSDIRPLVRFREPKLGYKAMMGLKPGVRSPLVFLKTYAAGLAAGTVIEPESVAVSEVRLFACSFVGALMRGVDRSRKRLARPGLDGERTTSLRRLVQLLGRADIVLRELRALHPVLKAAPSGPGPLASELSLADEYCYYRLRDVLAMARRIAADLPADAGPELEIAADELATHVTASLATQDAYATNAGFLQVDAGSSEMARETYLHRRGELKRRIWSVLFLDLRTGPMFAVQRQVGPMFAAGLAALTYSFIQLALLVQIMQPKAVRDVWGLSGMTFITVAACAYIIKDRIKEFGRSYFRAGVLRRIPDHSEKIYYTGRSGVRSAVGALQESARFIALSKLPAAVSLLRRTFADVGSRGSAGPGRIDDESIDRVLLYTKTIELSGKLRIMDCYPLRAVHDIFRLNIDACLPRLGEPQRQVDVATGDGGVASIAMPKVYYLDLALRYSRLGGATTEVLDFFRLVVDKNGLLRVERLT